MKEKTPSYIVDSRAAIERLRGDPQRYIALLESLLLDAEDMALARGDWGLIDCQDRSGGYYESQTCDDVLNNIRARATAKRNNNPQKSTPAI